MNYILENKVIEYGDRGCKVCTWNTDKGCQWKDSLIMKSEFPNCAFLPSEYAVPKMCANCKYGNHFVYEGDFEKPLETPNIYCDHDEGSLNRWCAYEDRKQKNFGVGTWDRQHEFDTCDRWEEYEGMGFPKGYLHDEQRKS